MILCPVADWKQQTPEALAFPNLTYRAFDSLIQHLCGSIETIPEKILAFIPGKRIVDIAFFFAAWRMGKTVYPLSFRHPKQALDKRILQTGAILIDPTQLSINSKKNACSTFDENILATLIETSSSEKIVCHSLKSHLISAYSTITALNLKPHDTYCLNLPLYHVSGIAVLLRCFLAGATLVFPENWKDATHISMVPTQLYRLCEKKESLSHLQCLLVGGAPLSQALYHKALLLDFPIYCSYGMTETASMALIKAPRSNTKILSHHELMLSSDGEILIRGPSLLSHYWGQPLRDPLSWFATQDIGKLNMNGEIEIKGRKDRQFISGGENISPEEIEQALLQFPQVIEARVEPETDPEFGMRPIATLYCASEVCPVSLQKKLEELLPRFKIPKKILFSCTPFQSKQLQLSEQ